MENDTLNLIFLEHQIINGLDNSSKIKFYYLFTYFTFISIITNAHNPASRKLILTFYHYHKFRITTFV